MTQIKMTSLITGLAKCPKCKDDKTQDVEIDDAEGNNRGGAWFRQCGHYLEHGEYEMQEDFSKPTQRVEEICIKEKS